MKPRTKHLIVAGCVVLVLCGATAVGLALAQHYQTPANTVGNSLAQKSGASEEPSGSASGVGTSGATAQASPGVNGSGSAATGAKGSPAGAAGSAAKGASNPSSPAPGPPGSGATGGGATKPKAATPAPAPAPAPKPAAVSISASCRTVLSNMDLLKPSKKSVIPSSGVMLGQRSVAIQDGDTVFSVLQRACKAAGVSLEYTQMPGYGSAYVKGIGNLDEFDCGPRSGWVYSVNGAYSSTGCSKYVLKAGDVVAFRYTCNGGADVGASGAR